MPELPEVETARRHAERRVLDHAVTAVACDEPLLLRNTTPQGLGRALTGSTITSVDRTGKWVRLATDARSDAPLHFGMTGSRCWYRDGAHGDIGNLLSDELCCQIEVHPATPCTDVGDVWDDLADALARALDVGLDLGHVPTADGFLLDVRDDEDAQCPRCGAPLAQATIAGRTSRWCPREQPDPR